MARLPKKWTDAIRSLSVFGLFLGIFSGVMSLKFNSLHTGSRGLANASELISDFANSKVRQYLTLDQSIKVEGPIWEGRDSKKYLSKIFRLLIQESHQEALRLNLSVRSREYAAFQMAVIATVYHESKFIHFRQSQDFSSCDPFIQKGELALKGVDLFGYFQQAFLLPKSVLADCSKLDSKKPIIQILLTGSRNKEGQARGDGRAVGMLQLHLKWHPYYFSANDKWQASRAGMSAQEFNPRQELNLKKGYLSVRATADYGISLLADGFSKMFADPPPCVKSESSAQARAIAMIRSAWSGSYNNLNMKVACRWKDAANDSEDAKFFEHLNEIYISSQSPLDQGLEGAELNAFRALGNQFLLGLDGWHFVGPMLK